MTATNESPKASSATRRHVLVLIFLSAACALGAYLVATGNEPTSSNSSSSSTTSVAPASIKPSPTLKNLGSFASDEEAQISLGALDPSTLQPAPDSTTSSAAATTAPATPVDDVLSEASRDRCIGPVVQQSPDRKVGDLLASGAVTIGGRPFIVTSHSMPATEDEPADVRVIITDAISCRIEFAIDG